MTFTHRLRRRLFSLLLLSFIAIPGHAINLDGTIWERAAAPGIDPYLLYAVALVESRALSQPGKSAPRPFVIRVGNQVHNFDHYAEAARALEQLVKKTHNPKKIDVGMMQINLGWHGHRVDRDTDLLIPAIGIHIASEILKEAMASTHDTLIGVGRYHSYTPHRATRYGSDVVHIACQIGWKNDACLDILGADPMYATTSSHGGELE